MITYVLYCFIYMVLNPALSLVKCFFLFISDIILGSTVIIARVVLITEENDF